MNQYKDYRNTLNISIRLVKEHYYQDKSENARGNSKVLWENINELTGVKSNKYKFPIYSFLDANNA